MCGIAGFAGEGTRADLERMTRALAHRGPDGEGFHIDPERAVFLGHRRLSIVDIEGGRQPMWNETGEVAVVFNGEIYNHEELRAELIGLGHRFASHHSDTEVLVHGYEAWGEGLPVRLNGMFAFAVFDAPRRRLMLARDRFGEKPLYYCARPGFLAFASELTALAEHTGVSRSLSPTALRKLFAYGFIPAPHAMLAGSAKLAHGHLLVHDLDAGSTAMRPYWQFRIEPDESLGEREEASLVDELGALLEAAARRRLMSDVPLGVFLSGGLDSSSVLAALTAAAGGTQRFRTFTIGFREPSFDESEPARAVAAHLGSDHNERILDIAAARDLIPGVLSRLDEPLGDGSILPTALLCRFAREQVTVALSGDGGDELFAGYDPFLALAPARLYDRWVPKALHRSARRAAELWPSSDRNMSLDFKIRRSLMGLSYPESARLPVWMAPLEPKELNELFAESVRCEDLYSEAIAAWEASPRLSHVDRTLEYFTNFYLPDDILMKVDRAAMMHSLETRAVFLDNDLVEFARRLPARFKLRRGERKYLLKRLAERYLPRAIVERKKKGFGIPLAHWLRTTPETPPLAPVPGIDREWARAAWDQHRSGKVDRRLFLWCWLNLQAVQARLPVPAPAGA